MTLLRDQLILASQRWIDSTFKQRPPESTYFYRGIRVVILSDSVWPISMPDGSESWGPVLLDGRALNSLAQLAILSAWLKVHTTLLQTAMSVLSDSPPRTS